MKMVKSLLFVLFAATVEHAASQKAPKPPPVTVPPLVTNANGDMIYPKCCSLANFPPPELQYPFFELDEELVYEVLTDYRSDAVLRFKRNDDDQCSIYCGDDDEGGYYESYDHDDHDDDEVHDNDEFDPLACENEIYQGVRCYELEVNMFADHCPDGYQFAQSISPKKSPLVMIITSEGDLKFRGLMPLCYKLEWITDDIPSIAYAADPDPGENYLRVTTEFGQIADAVAVPEEDLDDNDETSPTPPFHFVEESPFEWKLYAERLTDIDVWTKLANGGGEPLQFTLCMNMYPRLLPAPKDHSSFGAIEECLTTLDYIVERSLSLSNSKLNFTRGLDRQVDLDNLLGLSTTHHPETMYEFNHLGMSQCSAVVRQAMRIERDNNGRDILHVDGKKLNVSACDVALKLENARLQSSESLPIMRFLVQDKLNISFNVQTAAEFMDGAIRVKGYKGDPSAVKKLTLQFPATPNLLLWNTSWYAHVDITRTYDDELRYSMEPVSEYITINANDGRIRFIGTKKMSNTFTIYATSKFYDEQTKIGDIRIEATDPKSVGSGGAKSAKDDTETQIIIGVIVAVAIVALIAFVYQWKYKRHALLIPKFEFPKPDFWEYNREKLILGDEVGRGAFGVVYQGVAQSIRDRRGHVPVAVKECGPDATPEDKLDFIAEANLMKRFKHRNVISLLGVCMQDEPLYIIVELMSNGSMKDYLRAHNDTTIPELLQMCLDISCGLSYLGRNNFVHRDLAIRNCLLNSDKVAKIADFGMSRDVVFRDYYRINQHRMLPVRWMALESLSGFTFSTKSDVWSLGVVFWEITSYSDLPYAAMANMEVYERIRAGYRLPQPAACPDFLYAICRKCWDSKPASRPDARSVMQEIAAGMNIPAPSDEGEDSSEHLAFDTETELLMGVDDPFLTKKKCETGISTTTVPVGNRTRIETPSVLRGQDLISELSDTEAPLPTGYARVTIGGDTLVLPHNGAGSFPPRPSRSSLEAMDNTLTASIAVTENLYFEVERKGDKPIYVVAREDEISEDSDVRNNNGNDNDKGTNSLFALTPGGTLQRVERVGSSYVDAHITSNNPSSKKQQSRTVNDVGGKSSSNGPLKATQRHNRVTPNGDEHYIVATHGPGGIQYYETLKKN